MDELTPRARALIEAFFPERNARLAESLHELKVLEETSGLLSEVSGIADPAVLGRLNELGITPAAAAGLALVPLVVLAWADGEAHERERRAIFEGLENTLFFQTIDRDIVEAWLAEPPPPSLLEAWTAFVCLLTSGLDDAHAAALRDGIVGRARAVASAAGKFWGMGGTQAVEKTVLSRVEGAFSSCP